MKKPHSTSHADVIRLWTGSTVSQIGSAIGGVALTMIAIQRFPAGVSLLAMMALFSSVSGLLMAFPAGAFVETRRTRPIMITTDVVRAATMAGVTLLATCGVLNVYALCLVATINGGAHVLFSTASQVHLRNMVDEESYPEINGKMMSTLWLSLILGPAVAGLLLIILDPIWLCIFDGLSFLAAALSVALLRSKETLTPTSAHWNPSPSLRERMTGGISLLRTDRQLRSFFAAWGAFAGLSAAFSPICKAFLIQDLAFPASQYGLMMGISSVGGLAGAWMTRYFENRRGLERTMHISAWARSSIYLLFPFLTGGTFSVIIATALYGALLFTTSLTNSTTSALRMRATPVSHQARISALWIFAGTATGPLALLVIMPLTHIYGARVTLAVVATGIAATPLLLPRSPTDGRGVSQG
ncbi:hypothetical protein KEM60_02275 [Austwickia sp. TVS 96-490-7B]|uniref:MFS transporter n=1 Tax=Austwickia sp. TVS 96-490-7B TaxID=2830843 RepID=UPI001C5738A7|nr:MFS transporter [Austwickia sp. TVS 96-490-7B]MBW3086064.1 hypothetical protein [Austwickia sp. TVS 96-490-7B]